MIRRAAELTDLIQRLESYEADGNEVAAIQVRNRIVRVAAIRVRNRIRVCGKWVTDPYPTEGNG